MSSAAFSWSREVNVPNLPGMSPNRKSWIHRETSGEGFRRTAAISRPASALDRSLSTSAAAQCFANQTGELPSRPHTAALSRRPPFSPYQTSNNAAFDAFAAPPRPATAPQTQGRMGIAAMQQQSTSSAHLLPVKLPRFVELDKQVLRFYAHFYVQRPFDLDGPLGESTVEPLLCRKFIVYFYLFDETIEIFEPRELNAGIPQGVFFKRNKVKRDDTGEGVSPRDLIPGQRVCMLGQEFVITDADTFTREYFKREMDILFPPPLTEPEALPSDCGAMFATGLGSLTASPSAAQFSHTNSLSRTQSGANNTAAYTMTAKEKKSLKRTMSHTTKSNFNACSTDYHTTKAELVKTQRFLQFDGQVLRFMCVEVSGPSPPFFPELEDELIRRGEDLHALSNGHGFIVSSRAKKYALSFYLSSLEIDLLVLRERETKEERVRKGAGFTTRNNERASADEPLTILKRGRLAKNWREHTQRAQSTLSLPQFYEAEDLHCGEVIDVYGRYFLLCTCDAFTHEAYRERGVWQQEVCVVKEEEPVVRQPLPQSGDGFLAIGSPEDTLATVYGMPKVRKDYEKISRNQGRLLRAKAQMVTRNPIDATREFFVTFFLEDDTLQVFEEVKRNSGIWGGGFLKRGKYMNESPHDSLTSRPVHATDIFLGNTLTLNGSQFRITEMDNLSLSFCESFPDEFPLANIHSIVGAIMSTVKDRRLDVRALLAARDTQKTLSLSTQTFVDVLEAEDLTSSLTDQEILTIMRRFSPLASNPSQKETTNTGMTLTDDRLARERVYYLELCDMISHLYYTQFMHGRPQTATRKSENVTFNAFLANARARSVQWRRVFRLDPTSSKDSISLAQLALLFQKNGVTVNESLAREIVTRYAVGGVARSSDAPAENELDDVVSSRSSIKNQSSMRKAMQKANNMAAKIAELRKRNPLSSTNNLKRSKAWSVAPNAQPSLQENTSIDYNRLCDDIYVCDWV